MIFVTDMARITDTKDNWDILLDEDGDLLVENGDLVAGDATQQHIKHILKAHKGEFKWCPLLGVGIDEYVCSNHLQRNQLKKKVRANLKLAGYHVVKIHFDENGELCVEAYPISDGR